MPGQDPIQNITGLQGTQAAAGAASPWQTFLGAIGLGNLGTAAQRADGTQAPAAATTDVTGQDGFTPSTELQTEQQKEQQEKQAKIMRLMMELMQLNMEKQQQLQNGDETGAQATQAEIDQKTAEIQGLTGGKPGNTGTTPTNDAGSNYGNAGNYGGGGGNYGGGGNVGGGGGGGGDYGGGSVGGGGGGGGGVASSDNLNAPVTDAGGANVDVSSMLEPGGAAGIPEKYKNNQVAQLIWQEAKKAGADPYAMLATAVVESGLNPKAVGDNGTSFGLYQYHIGGALGNRSKEWAFNPANIIKDEAKRFASAGVRDGAGAAAVQRPADRAGYAVKVNRLIAEMKA